MCKPEVVIALYFYRHFLIFGCVQLSRLSKGWHGRSNALSRINASVLASKVQKDPGVAQLGERPSSAPINLTFVSYSTSGPGRKESLPNFIFAYMAMKCRLQIIALKIRNRFWYMIDKIATARRLSPKGYSSPIGPRLTPWRKGSVIDRWLLSRSFCGRLKTKSYGRFR